MNVTVTVPRLDRRFSPPAKSQLLLRPATRSDVFVLQQDIAQFPSRHLTLVPLPSLTKGEQND